jgi:predicted aspartyl protease
LSAPEGPSSKLSGVLFDVHDANIIWDGQFRDIEINSADTDPLLGMKMLRGYRLQVDTVQGGLVTVEALPILGKS